MKTILVIVSAVLISGFFIIGIWLLFLSQPSNKKVNPIIFPDNSISTEVSQNNTYVDIATSSLQEVSKAFFSQAPGTNTSLTIGKTIVASSYALQYWGDADMSGEALLMRDGSKGWQVLSMGGGAWDVSSLVQEGVPESVAQQLIANTI